MGKASTIYMDRHDLPGLTAQDVAEAHRQDLQVQHRFNCRALTYWFDEERGIAFCLIESPDEQSVRELHEHSHGQIPNQIIEVDDQLVEAFLGRIEDPEPFDTSEQLVLQDPAFRTIMVAASTPVQSDARSRREHHALLRTAIERYDGREVRHPGANVTASFTSTDKAVECALHVVTSAKVRHDRPATHDLEVTIGLSAGDPVTEQEELFGETIRMADRLCYIANNIPIWASYDVKTHVKGDAVHSSSYDRCIKYTNKSEERFLTRLMDTVEETWNDEHITVMEFSRRMGLSKSQLYRKTTALTGYSPSSFLKEFRLNKSIKLIEANHGNISEIAFETGFNNPSYFSKSFKERFGILPSEYAKRCLESNGARAS